MSDILDQHWTERSCKDNCGICLAGCMMCFSVYPAKTIGVWLYIFGSLMTFASFWQTEWIRKYSLSRFKKEIKTVLDFHLPESSSVINETSLEFNFKCQAGLWHVCCTKPNSVNIKSNTTNSSDVLECRSLTGLLNKLKSGKGSLRIFTICDRHNECISELMPNDASYQKELWLARVGMITSITIFFFWVTAST